MPLPPLPYLTYAQAWYPGARFNLASSNVPALPLALLQTPPDTLDITPELLLPRVAAQVAARYGVDPERVAVTLGTTGANSTLAALFGLRGGGLLTEWPGYEPLRCTPPLFGLQLSTFPRAVFEPRTLNTKSVIEALRPDTRAVSITNPHNPTGRLADPDDLAALAHALRARGVHLIVDEVYLDFTQPLGGPGSALQLHPGEDVIVTSSLTKVYGLGTLRVGWIVGPPEIAAQARLINIHLSGVHAGPSLAMGLAALERLEDIKRLATGHLEGRRAAIAARLDAHPRITWTAPDTGIVGVMRIDGVEDDLEFARHLREQAEIILAPGSFFGLPGTFRLGFGQHERDLEPALERLLQHLAHPP